jgi:hypothetical protein
MYKIETIKGQVVYLNERIIMKIHSNEDGTFTLDHFNNTSMLIKSFTKL